MLWLDNVRTGQSCEKLFQLLCESCGFLVCSARSRPLLGTRQQPAPKPRRLTPGNGPGGSRRAPLPGGCQMIAVHTLEPLGGMNEDPDGGGGGVRTRITHTFQFSGIFAGIFRWVTASYVQNGLDTNTVALKALAERPE